MVRGSITVNVGVPTCAPTTIEKFGSALMNDELSPNCDFQVVTPSSVGGPSLGSSSKSVIQTIPRPWFTFHSFIAASRPPASCAQGPHPYWEVSIITALIGCPFSVSEPLQSKSSATETSRGVVSPGAMPVHLMWPGTMLPCPTPLPFAG